ncbi:MAG: tetratricopeptide repeat protein [Verrucomicrobia subdivision 3 bacterium]|nr:tetratricopeptide repeat protein [Limisphaerales bacterium]
MRSLLPQEARHLQAAEGWLELGNHQEAFHEINQIIPDNRLHVEVVEVRAKIYAAEKNWQTCLMMAEILTDRRPNRPFGWRMLAAAQHGAGATEAAYETLLDVADQFENCSEVMYDLARYAAQLALWDDAKHWLVCALQLGEEPLKLKAIADPALKGLWRRIAQF